MPLPANVTPGSVLKVAMMDGAGQVQTGAVYVLYGPDGYQPKRLRFEEEPQGDRRETEASSATCGSGPTTRPRGRVRLPVEGWQRDYQVVALALTVENSL